jgi:hypothetical protein
MLSNAATDEGDYAGALAHAETALAMFLELGVGTTPSRL